MFDKESFATGLQRRAGHNGSFKSFIETVSASVYGGCRVDVPIELLEKRYPNYAAFLRRSEAYRRARDGSINVRIYALDRRSPRCVSGFFADMKNDASPDIPLECMVSLCLACGITDGRSRDRREIEQAVSVCCGEVLRGKGMRRFMAAAASRGIIRFEDIAVTADAVFDALAAGRSLGCFYELFEQITGSGQAPAADRGADTDGVVSVFDICSNFEDLCSAFRQDPALGMAVLSDETQLAEILTSDILASAGGEENATVRSIMKANGADGLYVTFCNFCKNVDLPNAAWFLKFALRMHTTDISVIVNRLKLSESDGHYDCWTAADAALRQYTIDGDAAKMYRTLDEFIARFGVSDKYYKALLPFDTVDGHTEKLLACLRVGRNVLPFINSANRLALWSDFRGLDLNELFSALSGKSAAELRRPLHGISELSPGGISYLPPDGECSGAFKAVYFFRAVAFTVMTGRIYSGQPLSTVRQFAADPELASAAAALDRITEGTVYVRCFEDFLSALENAAGAASASQSR